MALNPGTRLGPYEIQNPLGAGGMGEVYRALDTRLNRTVAIKVLASHLSSSPELKQRMEQEARAISSLNHPQICQLYDIGSQDGTDFLVMEFLEGETLADRLKKGPLPLNEVCRVGIAVAEALGMAHRNGIVHRDLKPGNVMLTQKGAKLMDFGLAKPVGLQAAASGSVPAFTAAGTISGPSPITPLTSAGTIVGTIQYMSPEQIEGKEADARSDIFALGAVLYEMTAGKRPFEGKSQLSLASSILEKDPEPVGALKPGTPLAFERVLNTCLQKNPDDRFQSAHDVKLELEWIAAEKAAPVAPAAPAAGKKERLFWIAALVVAIVLAAVAASILSRPAASTRTTRTLINPPEKTALNLSGDFGGPPVLSPDGASLAFTAASSEGKTLIWVRPMNALDAHSLPGTEAAIFPFWSPDSRSLAFFAEGKLKTIELSSGSIQLICDSTLGRGGAWGADGVILFSPNPTAPLMRVSANGGTPVALTKIDAGQYTSHRWPFFLPDGRHFLYSAIHHDASRSGNDAIYYASVDGKENRLLLRTPSNAIYAAGYLLFARGAQLMAQPFDPSSGKLSDEPRAVANGVVNDSSTWHMAASGSADGLLVFASGGSAELQVSWVDRTGKPLGTVIDKLPNLNNAVLSPQGDRIALQVAPGTNDIYVFDIARKVRTRLTFGPVANLSPVWSPDGKWIAYSSNRGGNFSLYRKASDGSGAEELLYSADKDLFPTCWSRDGKYLLFFQRAPNAYAEVRALSLEGERKSSVIIPQGFAPQLSPDGHWLAYVSIESGGNEVYVVPFGGGQGKWQVSANGGNAPRWSRDGKELYYVTPTFNIMAVPVAETGGALQFGTAQTLVGNWSTPPEPFYDVSPDGKKILLDTVSQQVNQSVTVVTNFPAALKKQ